MTSLSAQVTALWAKSTADGNGYSLLGHMLDVCAVAYVLLGREPAETLRLCAQDLGLPPAAARQWIAALVGLHDFGKATPTFERAWARGKAAVEVAGLPFPDASGKPKHGLLSQKLLRDKLVEMGVSASVAGVVADAIGAHHGFRFDQRKIQGVTRQHLGTGGWVDVRQELADEYFEAIGLDLTEPPSADGFAGQAYVRLAGLTTFSDWIGSTADYFPTSRLVTDPRAHYQDALALAESALDSIGWSRRTPLVPNGTGFAELFPDFAPNELQQATIEVVDATIAPSLIVVEAPMGQGKTEAALYAHAALQERLGHRGMYVALPSQATGNAMFERMKEFLASVDRQEPPDLQLLHGASILNDSYANIKVSGVDGPDNTEENVWARSWFTSNKRGLLSEYGVGTVDQALLGVLNLKHQPLRLWGLGNRTVVIDEVHAYELFTSELIEHLVEWLAALGSTVILLSATLPRSTRRRLLKRYEGSAEPEDVAYPRITQVQGGKVTVRGFAAGAAKPVRLVRAPLAVDELAPLVLDLPSRGGCAAAIMNTVQRAQDLYAALGEGEEIEGGKRLSDGTEVYLFHARYPAIERRAREAGVIARFGKRGTRPRRALLVATQVIEQSLDLDFDVMVTDLAPIDLIIQRLGRLHRHERPARPVAHREPVLHVAGLTASDVPPDLKSTYFDKVYEAYALYVTWLALADRSGIVVPDEIEALIEQVYGDAKDLVTATAPEIGELIRRAKEDKERADKSQSRNAKNPLVSIKSPQVFTTVDGVPLDSNEESEDPGVNEQLVVTTRLGPPSVVVIPLFKSGDEFYLEREHLTRVSLRDEPTWGEAKQLYLHHVKLSRREVVDAYRKVGRVEAWGRHPLLRYAMPLILEEGQARLGSLRIALDRHLGITYTRDP